MSSRWHGYYDSYMNEHTPITFITGNDNKVRFVERYIDMPIERQKLTLPEIQSLDLEEIVTDKALRAYAKLQRPVLVEDVSLTFTAYYDRLPGPLIRWYEETFTLEELCRLLDPHQTRAATATVMFGYYDGANITTATGTRHGTITDHERGDMNFGFGPIFQPEGWEKTWAQMDNEEFDQVSMRRTALEELRTKFSR